MGAFSYIRDGLANLMSGAGTLADKRAHAFYAMRHWSFAEIEAAYRSSWLMRKAVDLPPYDMVRAGWDWQADDKQIEALEAAERAFAVRTKLQRALVLGRLGGGAIILGVNRADPAMPLLVDQIRANDLQYIHVMSRWQLNIEGGIIRDPADPMFGQPKLWRIANDKGQGALIHPSRVIAFTGQAVPDFTSVSEEDAFWGDSVPQSIGDAVKNADMAQNGFASLIDEASIDVYGIPDLLSNLATQEYEERVMRRLALAKLGQSTHRAKIKDAAETWETRQVTWAGMKDMIDVYIGIVAGACDIPATRLLGKAPDGMNASGQGDQYNYDQMIAGRQENDLRPPLERIMEVLIRSTLGKRDPNVHFKFAPLSVMSEKDAATVNKAKADTIKVYADANLIPDIALVKGVQNMLVEDGWIPGLDGALAELDEDERFLQAQEEGDDPSTLQVTEPLLPIAANDALVSFMAQHSIPLDLADKLTSLAHGGAPTGGHPFEDARKRRNRAGSSHYREPDHPRGAGGRWVEKGGEKDTLRSFAAKAAARPKSAGDHVVGRVEQNAPAHVQGFTRVANAQEIRKNMNKHGDPERLISGQPAIEHADFNAIPELTRTGTFRVLGDVGGRKPQRIEYRGTVAGRDYAYVETVGVERQRVALLSFYRLK